MRALDRSVPVYRRTFATPGSAGERECAPSHMILTTIGALSNTELGKGQISTVLMVRSRLVSPELGWTFIFFLFDSALGSLLDSRDGSMTDVCRSHNFLD